MAATRRLAAILAADVAGYSRLMGADEERTLERLKALRRELVDPEIDEHHGRIVKSTGDGLLIEFASVVDGVRCAVAIQQKIADRDPDLADDRRIEFRIGINIGDIISDEGDLFGDGVNVAARLEALAAPGGICISRVVFDQVRDKLDFAFEDLGEQKLKNIARPVHVYKVRSTLTHPVAAAPGSPLSRIAGEGAERQRRAAGEGSIVLPLPDKPSIAVMPFANMSGDAEQEYFADGMVEEIITALSRIRWLFVIARNSSFTYKGQAVDVKQVGRELGGRYVLEGSVRKSGGRVRITAQLIEAATGTHLWADRFDGSLEDVFELQDKVAVSVAGVIEPTLQAAETARSAGRPTDDLTAYDVYLRAYAMFYSSENKIPEAIRLLEQAIERDPRYGPALGLAALCRLRLVTSGWSQDPEADNRKGAEFGRRALQAAGDDPAVLASSAVVLAALGEDIDTMMVVIDRALALNPSFARGWFQSARIRQMAGQPDLAIEHAEASLRLSPRARVGFPFSVIGAAHFVSRRYEKAVPNLLLAIQDDPGFPPPYQALAACYAQMGRLDEARATIARLRDIAPEVMVNYPLPFRDPQHRELYLSGLRLAVGETV